MENGIELSISQELFSIGAKRAAVNEISKAITLLAKNPEVISFAAGVPARESLPEIEIKKAIQSIFNEQGSEVLQYGPPQGIITGTVQQVLQEQDITAGTQNILITTGSIQGAFLVSSVLIDPGDVIITESPTYSLNLEVFRFHQADIIGIPLDENGMDPAPLRNKLIKLKQKGKKVKFIYVIPDFHNPTGTTMSNERRKQIVAIAREFDAFILEDAPYYFLRYSGKRLPTLREIGADRVIHLGSFSKIFSPGLRVGYLVAHGDIVQKLILAKQGVDFCSPTLNQFIVKKLVDLGLLRPQIKKIANIHQKKLNCLLDALKEYMPEGVHWFTPDGGIFLWMILPDNVDAKQLMKDAIQKKVAFIPGEFCYPQNGAKNTVRLCFTYPPEEKIKEGIRILANLLR